MAPTGNNIEASGRSSSAPDGDEVLHVIGPLLARANLLRLRGQWDEATAACTEALRKSPRSATAHSLLGAICEAQGKLDDAMQWYGMAVDLDPENALDRTNLQRIVDQKRVSLVAERGSATGGGTSGRAKTPTSVGDRTLHWWDHIFPPDKSHTIARLILVACGSIFVLLLFTAAFVWLRGGSGPAETETGPSMQPPVVVQPPPGLESGDPTGISTGTNAPRTITTPPANGPTSTPPPGTAAISATPASEKAFLEVARRAAYAVPGSDAEITEARVDPRSMQLMLSVALNGRSDETPGQTRERILRVVVPIGRATVGASPDLQRVELRVALRAQTTGENPPQIEPQTVFVADAAASTLRVLDPSTATAPQLRDAFTNVWWAAGLAPSGGPSTGL